MISHSILIVSKRKAPSWAPHVSIEPSRAISHNYDQPSFFFQPPRRHTNKQNSDIHSSKKYRDDKKTDEREYLPVEGSRINQCSRINVVPFHQLHRAQPGNSCSAKVSRREVDCTKLKCHFLTFSGESVIVDISCCAKITALPLRVQATLILIHRLYKRPEAVRPGLVQYIEDRVSRSDQSLF